MHLLKIFLTYAFLAANGVVIFFMGLCCLCTWISPALFPYASAVTLFFPLFLLLNIAFLLFWLVFKMKFMLFPLMAFAVMGGFVLDYCPFSWAQKPEASQEEHVLKVVSYNIGNLDCTDHQKVEQFVSYIKDSEADVLCLQEVPRNIYKQLNDVIPYMVYSHGRMIGSRHPFCGKMINLFHSEKGGNGSMACPIIFQGDTLWIVNNHLESYRLSVDERNGYKNAIIHPNAKGSLQTALWMARRIGNTSKVRGEQVEELVDFIEAHQGKQLLVCGDFNDNPISYTHRRMTKYLKSSWRESGMGCGFTYDHSGIFVRIDHIFISSELTSYNTDIARSVPYSDHYPIVTHIYKKNNKNTLTDKK